MDDLSITPEELAKIVGQGGSSESSSATSSSSQQLTQDQINQMLGHSSGTSDSGSDDAGGAFASSQITPEELAQITGKSPDPFAAAPAAQLTPEELAQVTGNYGGGGGGSSAFSQNATAHPVEFAPLQPSDSVSSATNLDLLLGVTLKVTVELGRTKMNIEEILKLGPGSVIELDKLAGEPVDVLINERLIARGEVVVIDDRFGVRITDVIPPAQRVRSLQ